MQKFRFGIDTRLGCVIEAVNPEEAMFAWHRFCDAIQRTTNAGSYATITGMETFVKISDADIVVGPYDDSGFIVEEIKDA